MSRKIILNIAMSIDGYIAAEDGSFDWIGGDGNNKLDTKDKFDFENFMEDVDLVVMGKNCYEQGFADDYSDKTVYVATTESLEDHDNVKFIKGDIVKTILEEKEKEGKNIYLFGGGILLDPFIKADVIDEYIIGIIPTILGSGKKLFLLNNPEILLNLQEYYVDNGIIITTGHISKDAKAFLSSLKKPYNIDIISADDLTLPYSQYILETKTS